MTGLSTFAPQKMGGHDDDLRDDVPVNLDRQRVVSATPSASIQASHERALAGLDPVAVADVAADPSQPWWRRRACARSLEGRLPSESAASLWSRVTDSGDVTEVRVAALSALCSWWTAEVSAELAASQTGAREQALTWLRDQSSAQLPYGMDEALTLARCKLGDTTVALSLAELTYDPWSHRSVIAERALAALLRARGLAALLDEFGVTSLSELATSGFCAEARYLGLDLLRREGQTDLEALITALEDEDIAVAQRAARDLQGSQITEATLLEVFDRHRDHLRAAAKARPPLTGRPAAACWALVILGRRHTKSAEAGEEPLPSRPPELLERLGSLGSLGDCEVPLPSIPRDVRAAILCEYLPGERTTDPRHILEGLALDLDGLDGLDDLDALSEFPQQARRALLAAGLSAGEPTPIGAVNGQGGGSYELLEVGDGQLALCTFGPFARATRPVSERATTALESAGFRVVDDDLAALVFEGLPVYFFGDREPLSVQDLLFYWQD